MSPEQALVTPLDRRTDIFSLGIVLYELLTSKRLFKAKNDVVVLNKICRGDIPSPGQLRPDCPRELEAIVMNALAVDLSERFPTALDFQLALEDFARVFQLPVSPDGRAQVMSVLFGRKKSRQAFSPPKIPAGPPPATEPAIAVKPVLCADDVIDLDSLDIIDLDSMLED